MLASGLAAPKRAVKLPRGTTKSVGRLSHGLLSRLLGVLPVIIAFSAVKQVMHQVRCKNTGVVSLEYQDAALKQLHAQLPAAIKASGCGKRVKLWGVDLRGGSHPLTPEEDGLLRQFLRAREWDVEKTRTMIEETLRWRRAFGVERLRPEQFKDFPADEVQSRPDANGHTVITLRLGAVALSAFNDRAKYLRWRLCMQEMGLRSLALGRGDRRPGYVYVLDCAGLKGYHVGRAARSCAMELAKLLMDFYPDYLTQTHIVNAPSFVAPAWRLFRAFLPSAFCNAVRVIEDGKENKNGFGS